MSLGEQGALMDQIGRAAVDQAPPSWTLITIVIDAMYRPKFGTWYRALFRIDARGQLANDFDYDGTSYDAEEEGVRAFVTSCRTITSCTVAMTSTCQA